MIQEGIIRKYFKGPSILKLTLIKKIETNTMKKLIALSFLLAGTLLLVQCGDSETEPENGIEEEKQEVLSNLEDLRDDLDERIEQLSNRIDNAGEEAEDDWEAALEELEEERSQLNRTIDEVEDASSDNWESIKSRAEDLSDDISSTMDEWENDLEDLFNE